MGGWRDEKSGISHYWRRQTCGLGTAEGSVGYDDANADVRLADEQRGFVVSASRLRIGLAGLLSSPAEKAEDGEARYG